jgi:tetratricopeptide (TPR) repeat protein
MTSNSSSKKKIDPKRGKRNSKPFGKQPGISSHVKSIVGIVFLVLLSFSPVFHAGFIWDDASVLQNNPLLTKPGGLLEIWTTHGHIPAESHYWPVEYTLFWIESRLWGFAPLGYHLMNLFWHAANCLMIWAILRREKVPGAWIAGALFAVHPAHAETVAWISERKELVSVFFCLMSAYLFLSSRNTTTPNKRIWPIVASTAVFALALLSKSSVVALPIVLAFWLALRDGAKRLRPFLALTPMLLVGILIAAIDLYLQKGTDTYDSGRNALERLLFASRAFWFYVGKLVLPIRMTTLYPAWTIDANDPIAWVYPIATLALFSSLWIARKRIGKIPLFVALHYGLFLAPVLGFIDFQFLELSPVGDRFQYLASMAPLALLSAFATQWFLDNAKTHRRVFLTLCCITLATLAVLTALETRMYRNYETLFTRAVRRNPNSALAHTNLGYGLTENKAFDQAIVQCREAIRIVPNSDIYRDNLGYVYKQKHDIVSAIRLDEEAVRLNPRAAMYHVNLAELYGMQGNEKSAIEHYETALKLGETSAEVLNNLAWYLAAASDPKLRNGKRAIELAQKAVSKTTNQSMASFLDTLAVAYAEAGRFDEAIDTAQKAIDRATEQGDTNIAKDIATRLALYEKHKPYRAPPVQKSVPSSRP